MSDAAVVVDTNVVSELMLAEPARAVLEWFGGHDPSNLFISAISEAELRTGAAVLPAGKRRSRLISSIDIMIDEDFAGRVLPFDSSAAKAYAAIAAKRRAAGRPISEADCQIAAIAFVLSAAVATRNVDDFAGCGITVVNPWHGADP